MSTHAGASAISQRSATCTSGSMRIHVQARLEDAAQCLLVIIGATPEGKKELVGLIDGVREKCAILEELLLDLKRRGLRSAELAVADGALGFWQAIEEVWPQTRGQRCWAHKTANVLNCRREISQARIRRSEIKKDALGLLRRVLCLRQRSTAALPPSTTPAELETSGTTNVVKLVRHRAVTATVRSCRTSRSP